MSDLPVYSIGLEEDTHNPGVYHHDHPFGSPFESLLTPMQRQVFEMIGTGGSCIRYDGTCYMFIPSLGTWWHCRSSPACRYLAEMLGMDNVSVNFGIAVDPYLSIVESHSMTTKEITRSVCIGTFRMFVQLDGNTVLYAPLSYIASEAPDGVIASYGEVRKSGFCFKSISSSRIPYSLSCNFRSLGEDVISNVLNDDYLRILMWSVGNSILDPVSGSKVIILIGAGGNGKTETINVVQSNTIGISAALTQDYIGNDKLRLREEDVQILLNNRIVTFGDCELQDGYKVNPSFLKLLTSNDRLTTKTISGKVQCLGLFGTNNMYFPMKSVLQPWFARRVVTMNIPPITVKLPPLPNAYNDIDMLYFINSALKTRLSFEYPPVPVNVALDTIFGSKSQKYTRGVMLDDTACEFESYMCCDLIAAQACIEVELLIDLVYKVNPSLVEYGRYSRYIKNISVLHIHF